MKSKTGETTSCVYCNGLYFSSGACPKYGLKFRNNHCPVGEAIIKFKEVKVRNDVPWWVFWKSKYKIDRIVTEAIKKYGHY